MEILRLAVVQLRFGTAFGRLVFSAARQQAAFLAAVGQGPHAPRLATPVAGGAHEP